jgi:hypothetical protein
MKKLLLLALVCGLAAGQTSVRAQASSEPADDLKFDASIYVFLPSISGHSSYPVSGGGTNVGTDAQSIMSKLSGAFMGSFAVHKGDQGIFTDVLYVKFADTHTGTRDFTVGNAPLPIGAAANTDAYLKGLLWTVAGEYQFVANHGTTAYAFAGVRMLKLDSELTWLLTGNVGSLPLPDLGGTVGLHRTNWDGIVGLRGRVALGDSGAWYLPYYLDIGTGESSFVSQGMVGVGRDFSWGTLNLGYRYINYDFKSTSKIDQLRLYGPQLGVAFHW